MAREGQPVVTTNAQADPRFSSQESVIGYNLRSILCVPLRVRDKVTGVIYADNRIRTGLFSDSRPRPAGRVCQPGGHRDRERPLVRAGQAATRAITEMKTLMDNVFASIPSGVIIDRLWPTRSRCSTARPKLILGVPTYRAIHQPYRDVLPHARAAWRASSKMSSVQSARWWLTRTSSCPAAARST